MPPNGFGPFDLVDDLKKSGFPQKQAEGLAKLLSNMESQSAVTKQDLEATKLELKRDIKELDVKIENIRRDIKKDMLIASGSIVFLILTGLVTLAKLGLLTPVQSPIP